MIGSLAGATGSGAFLQIALLLGELARDRNMRCADTRPLSAADVFAKAGRLPVGQIRNVGQRYAALKESERGRAIRDRPRHAARARFRVCPGAAAAADAVTAAEHSADRL